MIQILLVLSGVVDSANSLPKTGTLPADYFFIMGGIVMIGGYLLISREKLFKQRHNVFC